MPRILPVLARTGAMAAVLVAPLAAQGAGSAGSTLPRGARVRVSAPRIPARLEARVDTIRGDTLLLNAGQTGYAVAVPLLAVRRIEVPDGEGSRAPRALLGATAGVMVGGLLGYQTALVLQKLYPDCANCTYDPLPSERREWLAEDRRLRWVWAAGVGAATGIVAGFVGHRRPPGERWRDVPLPLRVAVAPAAGGGAVVGMRLETR